MAAMDPARVSSPPAGAGWGARFAAAAVLVASFWFVGHSLDESKTIEIEQALGPNRAENRVAVQQAETTTSSAIGFLLVGGLGAVLLATARFDQLRWNAGLLLLCGVYVAWLWMSILWSIDPMQSFRKLTIFTLLLVAAFGAATRFDLEDLVWVVLLALTFFVGLGVLAEAAHGTLKPWRGLYRFSGTVHPNDQGVQCGLLAMAAALAEPSSKKQRWWLRALAAVAIAGLWFTKSRTTLASFVVAAAVGLIVRSRGTQRWLVLSGCLTLACIGGIVYDFVSAQVVDETATVAAMGRRKDVNSLTGRLPLWEELVHAASKRPWLGYGHGGFWNSENTFLYSEMFDWHIPHGHNAYLDLVLNVGLVGLGLYLLWFLAGLGSAIALYERTGRSGALFVVCLCVFSAVHGVTESKFPGAGIGGLALTTALTMLALGKRELGVAMAPGKALPLEPRGRPWRKSPAWTPRSQRPGRAGQAPAY
jgi:O-antigen ligase